MSNARDSLRRTTVRPIDGVDATPLHLDVLRVLFGLTESMHAFDIAEQTRGADGPVTVFLSELEGKGWVALGHDSEGQPRFELTPLGRLKAAALLAEAAEARAHDHRQGFNALMRRVRLRWPDANEQSVTAAVEGRDPVLLDLYQHARAELDELAEDNPRLRALLDGIARGGDAR
jgi:DNA-binding MarR family transcriptional regulator